MCIYEYVLTHVHVHVCACVLVCACVCGCARARVSAWVLVGVGVCGTCERISGLGSASMSSRPSRKFGRWSSISMSGTESRRVIHLGANARRKSVGVRVW